MSRALDEVFHESSASHGWPLGEVPHEPSGASQHRLLKKRTRRCWAICTAAAGRVAFTVDVLVCKTSTDHSPSVLESSIIEIS